MDIKWSKDWDAFDWQSVCEKTLSGENDIGITKDELTEFFHWMYENKTVDYFRVILYLVLRYGGMEEEDALYSIAKPEDLFEIVQKKAQGILD